MIQRPVNFWSWLFPGGQRQECPVSSRRGRHSGLFLDRSPSSWQRVSPTLSSRKSPQRDMFIEFSRSGVHCLGYNAGTGWSQTPQIKHQGGLPTDWPAARPIGTCLGTRALISHPPAGPSAWGIRNTACLVSRGVQPRVQGSNLSQAFCYNPRIHFLSFLHMHETCKYITWGTQKDSKVIEKWFPKIIGPGAFIIKMFCH